MVLGSIDFPWGLIVICVFVFAVRVFFEIWYRFHIVITRQDGSTLVFNLNSSTEVLLEQPSNPDAVHGWISLPLVAGSYSGKIKISQVFYGEGMGIVSVGDIWGPETVRQVQICRGLKTGARII